jgi:hypothetical protein
MMVKNFKGWLFEQSQNSINKNLTKRVNFPTGFHSAAKANLDQILTPSLADIEKFLKDTKGQVIQIELFGSESAVPNYDREVVPKVKLAAGELSKKRISTIKTFMNTWLDGLVSKGIITQKPEFKETVYNQPASEWNPPAGATAEEIKTLAGQEKYTKEQYLEVRLSVLGEIGTTDTLIKPDETFETGLQKALTSSSRTPGATANDFNKSIFYNYSVAPGAVLGKTLDEIKKMPGAMLTMNDGINIGAISSKLINLPEFKFKFVPNGGQKVKTVRSNDDRHTANVADSYSIQIPFKEGTQQWKWAWMVAHWYIVRSFPQDWSFISNKPTNVDWTFIGKALNLEGTPPNKSTSLEAQSKLWPDQTSLDRYAERVNKVWKPWNVK